MKKNFGRKAMLVIAGCLLLWASNVHTTIVSASNQEKKVYVYHRHTGTKETQGGCYMQPVYHEHTEDKGDGSGCYSKPVYHAHSGSETEGGGCYTIPVMHVHEGDGTCEDGCYKAVFHQHSDGCYKRVKSEDYGCYIVDWWDTSDDDWRDSDGYFHDYRYYEMSCGQTIHGTNSGHYHNQLNCSRGNEVTGYTLGCGKDENTVDAYKVSCEKTDASIEGYELGCNKSSEDIDSYGLTCGKDEQTAYGVMTVTVSDTGNRKAILQAEFEDLTGGELGEKEYVWYGQSGNEIHRGAGLTVSENGTYKVTMQLNAEGMTPELLSADISVDCIVKPSIKEEDERKEYDSEEEHHKESQIPGPTAIPSPTATPIPSPIPIPTPTLVPVQENTENEPATTYEEGKLSVQKERYVLETEEQEESTPTPSVKPVVKKTVMVRNDKRAAKPEVVPEIEIEEVEEKEESFFAQSAVKVVTLAFGILVAVITCLLLLFILRRSVAVYNDDGEGNFNYLGRCLVFYEEEGWVIVVTEKMKEKSKTNKYCIRPDFFLIGKREQAVIVECGQKRVSSILCKEMNVII